MDAPDSCQTAAQRFQNVVVMRHGDRIDNFEPLWVSQAARPWDPPLVQAGKDRAFCTGTKLRSDLGFQINRVFVSPFIRCVETAVQVVTALSASEHPTLSKYESDQPLPVDPSKLKVSIEYGLCEMLNKEAIRGDLAPKDGQRWGFNIPELEALFPAGTVDQTVERVYKELPQWGESVTGARARYAEVILALADKYPTENLLLVTHGEGVGSSISLFLEGATVYEVNYCAYSELRRPVFDKDQPTTAGKFEVVKNLRQTGLSYSLEIAETGDLSLPSE
ncbi:hypothetical protein PRUPE_2G124000 [Prunus persica]|uniref:Phosphoglycerate mutase family protein n=1 Tax=Prunus persica TaxID=3760 RepID=M5VRJ4_PRUPE|nr:uncharacterized protein LOC18771197 [Prunus persica]ONI22358.1 hypothetical protein PRUPE_2G124000 [Prunus persica]